jgi:hypothetical protein
VIGILYFLAMEILGDLDVFNNREFDTSVTRGLGAAVKELMAQI